MPTAHFASRALRRPRSRCSRSTRRSRRRCSSKMAERRRAPPGRGRRAARRRRRRHDPSRARRARARPHQPARDGRAPVAPSTCASSPTARSVAERAQKLFGIAAPPSEPLQLLRTARVNVARAAARRGAPADRRRRADPAAAARRREGARADAAAEIAADLAARISELEEIPEHAVAEASESLVRALEAAGGLATQRCARRVRRPRVLAPSIVNEMSSDAGDELLGEIAERDETIATRIREAMFTFEDLAADRRLARWADCCARSRARRSSPRCRPRRRELRDHFLGVAVAARRARRCATTCRPRRRSGCPRSRPRSARSSRPR